MMDPVDQLQTTELAKYDAARRALIECATTDEVLEIRNQAHAWAAYARQAKDRELEVKAMHIRFRAVRRLGELLLAQKETVGLAKGGQPYQAADPTCADTEQVETRPPTLKEAGIDRKLSSQAQRMAQLPAERFEALLGKHQAEAMGGAPKVSADLLRVDSEDEGRAHRRNLAAELSAKTIELPTGQAFPCWYVDLPWQHKGGVTDRSYENHYPTMTWPEILTFLRHARPLLLPDAWGFFWIPRAHLLALVEVERELQVAATGELVVVKDKLPLSWAIAEAAGFDSYSTCFVWTKNDAEHPDEAGTGKIAYDQDELLLLFKRGRGLPMPETANKYGSNHRERARLLGHSRKPEHYRRMIVDMVGRDLAGEPLPVMEFFARVDAEHPLPRNWAAWGNQSHSSDEGGEATATAERPAGTGDRLAEPLEAVTPAADPDRQQPRPCPDTRVRKDAGVAPGSSDQIAAGVTDSHADEPAPPAELPSVPGDGTVDAPAGSPSVDSAAPAVPPADRPGSTNSAELVLTELEILKAFASFADPNRRVVVEAFGEEYQAKGYAIAQGGTGEWILRERGQARLRELQAEQPAPARDPLELPDFLRRGKRPPSSRPQLALDLAAPMPVPDLAPTPAPAALAFDLIAHARGELGDDGYSEYCALLAAGARAAVTSEAARDLIGKGYADLLGDDVVLTVAGGKWLRSIEQHLERAARVKGETTGIALEPIAQQVDLEELLAS